MRHEPRVVDRAEQQVAGQGPGQASGLPGNRVRRLAMGSFMASANLVEQLFHLGVRSGARATETLAGSVLRRVPGSGLLEHVACSLDQAAGRAERSASERVARSLDLMKNGRGPSNEQARERPRATGKSWSELAVDTAMGPFEAVLGASLNVGAESIRETLSSHVGQLALDAGLRRLRPAAASSLAADPQTARVAFLAVATDFGTSVARELLTLAEAAAHLSFSDTRNMRRTVGDRLEEMRRLVATAELQDLLPTPVISEAVRARARWVVERAPHRFLAALEPDVSGRAPGWGTLVRATLSDADNLGVFVFVYPQVLVLIGTDVGKLLLAGTISFPEMAAFMEGRRFGERSVTDGSSHGPLGARFA